MIPVRAVVALIATAVATVLMLSFKTPDQSGSRLASGQQSTPAQTAAPSPGDQAATGPVAAGSSPPAGSASSSSSATGSTGLKDGQFSGQDVQTRYGDVQVQVIVSGGRIADVQAVQLPSDRARSAEISQVAGPMLHDEVLQAQSAQIDVISGATYTSEGYAESVQSALDQAHA